MGWVVQRGLVLESRGSREGRRAPGKDLPGRGGNAIEIKYRARASMPYYPQWPSSTLQSSGQAQKQERGQEQAQEQAQAVGSQCICM